MVSAGAVSCDLRRPIRPGRGILAASHPNKPEHVMSKRTQHAQQAPWACAHERTQDAWPSERTRGPQGLGVLAHVERTRAGEIAPGSCLVVW